MDGKLSEEKVKCLQAPWRFSLRTAGFEDRLLTALELFERFPLDITVTGGTPDANAQLASAVCGLDMTQETEEEDLTGNDDEEEEEEEEDEEDEEDWEEDEEADEEDDIQPPKDAKRQSSRRKRVRIAEHSEYIGWGVPDFESMLSHSRISNVRVRTVQDHPISNSVIKTNSKLYDSTHFDVLVVLTTEERKEDHMWLKMELHDRDKPFFLVNAEKVWDVVEEKPSGPCMTCAWERMRTRNLELQKRRKEAFGESAEATDSQSPSNTSDASEFVEMKDIGEVFAKALPDLKKKAFSQFLVAITRELRIPKFIADETQVVVSTSLKYRKINQEDLNLISKLSQPRDVTDHPSKLLAILTSLDDFRLDIGVLGETGCGSSSLVNALLAIKNNEEQSAPTGVIETTKEPTEYPYPVLPNISLWDLPGLGKIGGLDSQPSASGFNPAQLVASMFPCDVYILLSPLRLRLGIIQLMQQLSSLGKEYYLVISMADLIEETFVGQVREWAEGVLGEMGLRQNLFLVSAQHPETLDFPKLKEMLNKAIPSHKKVALVRYAAKLLDQDVFWKRSDSCKFM
ncbi:uncharacterized protein zmp:0000000951 [Triplophysa rosa]|uniref:IRG-type G domain-containing protein n=1 Tax=Triplophysa rosa TaxID=992332 RepID=A0A9W8C3T3_TRIRA|nr:uncharacterized protein zmp:0000000951 [Triplophysa rosa]KAI7806399.1 hypothetical protein IRJ41_005259 [Triplophysa rosa]